MDARASKQEESDSAGHRARRGAELQLEAGAGAGHGRTVADLLPDQTGCADEAGGGHGTEVDHTRAPVLDALLAFRRRGDAVFGPPGHRQGRAVDPATLEVLGEALFAADVLLLNGLDDRRESQGVLEQAQELMADAVHAERAFFSTPYAHGDVRLSEVSSAARGCGRPPSPGHRAAATVLTRAAQRNTPLLPHPLWPMGPALTRRRSHHRAQGVLGG